MASGKWTFMRPYKGWSPGDSIEPNMCLSGGELVALRRAGMIVPAEDYKEPKKRGRPPKEVIETADAPPVAERAVLTSVAKPARLKKSETRTPIRGEEDK